jgi:AraC-like DNA-binding protein
MVGGSGKSSGSLVGYVDQAHLNRRFKRFLGTTPGRFGGGR